MVKSFLSHYDETGLLPVWSMKGNETNMMIGYHAVPVIVEMKIAGRCRHGWCFLHWVCIL